MDNRNEVREFLSSRRARITPDRAGLPIFGDHRRVPGLRREEVSILAGGSVDYYTRMERGSLGGVSDGVLEAVAGALQLDDAERAYLFDLARAATHKTPQRRRASQQRVRPSVQRILDSMTAPPPTCATAGATSSERTCSVGLCTRRCSATRCDRSTTRGSSS